MNKDHMPFRRAAYALVFPGLLLLAACRAEGPAARDISPPPPPTLQPGAPPLPLKIYVTESGMYELPVGDLETYGLAADPAALRLFYQGRPQPVWLAGEGPSQTLRFYGQASESRYAAESVYFLQAGDGPADWMEETPGAALPAGSETREQAQATLHLEANERYSPQVESGDHFFWRTLAAPGSTPFDFMLAELAAGGGWLRVEVWASTEAPQDPDHRMRLALNGTLLADLTWDGIGRHTLDAEIPAGALSPGENQVIVEAPGQSGVVAEVVFIDWLEIDYPRRLVAEDGRLAFSGADQPLRLSGFHEPVTVFDVTDPEAVSRMGGLPAGEEKILLAAAGRNYLAVGEGGYLRPARVAQAWMAPDLRAAGSGADYVAIGPAELLEPLAPLLEWRAGQGLKVQVVPLEAVFDQFGDGVPEPAAIQALMAYAAGAWDPAPRYLLLVGDASYDPRGYLAPPEANRLPTFLVQTVYGGETASDVPFGQLDDDPWPEIAVGRLPARTADQVAVIVKKILAYEAQPPGADWQKRVLAVADGQSVQFGQDARTFLDRFPVAYDTELFAPEAGVEGAGAQVRARIEAGAGLVAYFGHGSVTQWGKDDLFTVEDIAGLGNGDRLPVVVNMTCLTGLFTHPEVESLAEALLWEAGGGAVAVLAPTSLTLPTDQGFLSAALVAALEGDPGATLGEISLAARRAVSPDTTGGRDVLMTFLLFGDPGLRLGNGNP